MIELFSVDVSSFLAIMGRMYKDSTCGSGSRWLLDSGVRGGSMPIEPKFEDLTLGLSNFISDGYGWLSKRYFTLDQEVGFLMLAEQFSRNPESGNS